MKEKEIDLSRYPEILRDIIDKGAERITDELGMAEADARRVAYLITEIIRREWAGNNLYLAKGLAHDITRRDREMFGKFTGANHAALAREYGITVRQVYDRLAIIQEEEFKRRQPPLFAANDD